VGKPLILLTNDDGYLAPGLLALYETLKSLGEVWVLAPDRNWSAASRTRVFHKPLRVSPVRLPDGVLVHITNGSPSDCVSLAILGLAPRRPDVVVSGINAGANLGRDVTYSGTVAAAMEAAQAGIPALAISQDLGAENGEEKVPDYQRAAQIAASLVEKLLANSPLPSGTLLNVNVPLERPKGVKITRLGTSIWRDYLVKGKDPRGRDYYWLAGEMMNSPPPGEEDTDVWAVFSGYISITPLQLDLTDHRLLKALRVWEMDFSLPAK